MKKIKLSDVKPYAAPGHFDMVAMRLSGKEETGAQKFWVGLSYFLPGGGAEWAYEDNPNEKFYWVLSGELTVKTKAETYKIGPNEGIFMGPKEGREIINETKLPVSMLVVINY
jgi:mannose-6-phosphate isomerase-like protein (cupin superfamily)